MDIFEKCYAPSLAGELKEKGVYPYFHALQSRQDVEVMMEGKRRIMLGSNNYLGLTTDPVVVEAGIKALERYRLLRLPLPQRHAGDASGAGGRAGQVPAQARHRHLRYRLPVQCGHHLRAGGPSRLRHLRP